jgi:hypothetical protein
MMTGQTHKHIFQRWLTERHSLNVTGKSINDVADERMSMVNFHSHTPLDYGRAAVKAFPDTPLQPLGIVGLHHHDIAPYSRLEFGRRPDGDETALMQDAHAIAALGFFQTMRGQQNTDAIFVSEMGEMGGKIQTGARIEAGARLVEQQ